MPPKVTLNSLSKTDIQVGQNLILTCNSSGDPLPSITWTRDGVPQSQFNFSGYELHIANAERKDVGSYRCTASNGYGKDVSKVIVVGLNCK